MMPEVTGAQDSSSTPPLHNRARITVKYFAMLSEQAQKSKEELETELDSPELVYNMLQEKYGFDYSLSDIRIAVNKKYVMPDTKLQDGDELVFIPPVAGG